ncbi:peptide-methionine (R)-S-oxide reductase MsrB [Kangiella sp. TOML190]|uniref:peptide-methionine (R)-S-oxide reductase MsrB n=1 Tax=Kangiella sp. TOML190 TaxID=2931351 RepID=UPI002040E49E|nr:peptide-methionine (R)-S-oxide reductase MsrB [Kangiella sp. TOML190]
MVSFDYSLLDFVIILMISILGAGAIGQLLAHKLTDASIDCQFIVRDRANYSNDWQLLAGEQSISRQIGQSKATDSDVLNLVAVCVKAPQLQQALQSIAHRLDDKSQLILFQNGMGHEAIAEQFVAKDHIYFASNTHGAFVNTSSNHQSSQTVTYAGVGSIELGALKPQAAPAWFELLKQAELNAHWHQNITHILWQKLLINAVINPLTALYQCKNGELLSPDKKPRLLALIQENQGFAKQIQLSFSKALKDLVIRVIENTADNFNSMYQDVNKGIATEINAINGYLLDQMAQAGFKAPHNWQLWSDFHISYPPQKAKAVERAKGFDPLQYQVTQQAGTERPFTGTYNQHSETGDYLCACCDSILFDNQGKFDSHCGWPSFDKAKNNKAIAYRDDLSHGMSRTEILCAQCGSHLGHVFDDGPTETGLRFCVNSVSLNFKK